MGTAEVDGFGLDPFTASAAELLRSVAGLAPGPYVQSVLLMIDRASLSPEDAVTFLQVHERVTSWWQGLQVEALVAAASEKPRVDEFRVLDPRPGHEEERTIRIADAVREEVAAAMRWSPSSAQRRIDQARLLRGPLAQTGGALARGEITSAHVAVIVEAAQRLSTALDGSEGFAEDCRLLQGPVLRTARHGTVSRTKAAANRWVERIDASGQRARRDRLRGTRDVYVTEAVDGIATLIARLDAVTAHAIRAGIDAHLSDPAIRSEPGASAGERRAEVLAALVLGVPAGGTVAPPTRSLTVNMDVTIPIGDLLAGADGTALLSDGTPVGNEALRRLLADPAIAATLRPVVIDDRGHVLDVGRRRYAVTGALRRLIVARDRTCRFPGCRRSARTAQIDHAQPWDDDGRTDVDNLGALCGRHHQLKTHAGWDITDSRPDGSCTWQSPHGRSYGHHPPPY